MENLILVTNIIFLTVLFFYSMNSAYLLYYFKKKKNQAPPQQHQYQEESVTIQLPIFNEMYVAERLIDAVCQIDYPRHLLEIQVLDDSNDETIEIINRAVLQKQAEGYDINVVRRPNRKGYKAGALKYGLETAKGNFIAVFDADFIPKSDFLYKTLPHFISNKIGMVQTRWGHLNEDYSVLTKLQAMALNGHFVIEQTVRNKRGFFINFNGTGGVWRKECILDAGNWHEDTVAEDADLSYRAQLKGWKFLYLNQYTTEAELPVEMNALKTQQYRWAKGTVQVAKKILPKLWRSDARLGIKLEGTFHLTGHFVFPIILLLALLTIPMTFLKSTYTYEVYFNSLMFFMISLLASFLFYLYAQKDISTNWKDRIKLFPFFLTGSMGLAINNTKAVFEGLMSSDNHFVRTPKFSNTQDNLAANKYMKTLKLPSTIYFEIFLTLYTFASIILGIALEVYSTIFINTMFFFGFASVTYYSLRTVIVQRLRVRNANQ